MDERKRDKELYDKVSQRLKDLMAEKGLKAIELAKLSGVNRSNISQYTNGVHIPTTTAAYKMAQVLGCSPSYLMGYDDSLALELGDLIIEHERKADAAQESYKRISAYALKLYELYDKASPEVQKMVDYLLKTESK